MVFKRVNDQNKRDREEVPRKLFNKIFGNRKAYKVIELLNVLILNVAINIWLLIRENENIILKNVDLVEINKRNEKIILDFHEEIRLIKEDKKKIELNAIEVIDLQQSIQIKDQIIEKLNKKIFQLEK